MKLKDYYTQTKWVTLLSAAVNLILTLGKLMVGYFANSHGLIADGVHSFSDLLTDFLVLLAAKFGSQDADWDHPYGHGRIETAATLGLALFIIVSGLGIAGDALYRVWMNSSHSVPEVVALWMALCSVLLNEWVYRYTLRVGERIQSDLLIANAWHNRSDAASSLVVVVGVGLSLLGYPVLDTLSALIVALMIIKMGASIGWSSVRELIDTGLDQQTLEQTRQTIAEVSGVCSLHQLRSRSMGGKVLIDVHILVDPYISVSEGHFIGAEVALSIRKALPAVTDVTVHIDPEDDEANLLSMNLPNRTELLKKVPALKQLREDDQLVLHYLNGRLEVNLYLASTENIQDQAALTQMVAACKSVPEVAQVYVWRGEN